MPTPMRTPSPTPERATDCEFTWGEWSSCSRSCGGGHRHRAPIVTREAEHGGVACPEREQGDCSQEACKTPSPTPETIAVLENRDCVFQWGQWSTCNRSCGSGQKQRSAIISQHPSGTGQRCPPAQHVPCQNKQCGTLRHGKVHHAHTGLPQEVEPQARGIEASWDSWPTNSGIVERVNLRLLMDLKSWRSLHRDDTWKVSMLLFAHD